MKNNVILNYLKYCIATLSIFLFLNQQNIFAHTIDEEEQKCIAKTSSTTEMNKCSQTAIDSWNKEINNVLYHLQKNIDKDTYNSIIQSQKNWEKYKNEEIKTFNNFLQQYSQGTMYQNVSKGFESNLVKQRAIELQDYKNIYP